MKYAILILLLTAASAQADDVGMRYNNVTDTGGIFDWKGGNIGKLLEAKYDWTPLTKGLGKNVFFEGALGKYFAADFDTSTSWVGELSPGLEITTGPVRFKISQGLAYIPAMPSAFEFATHFGVELMDAESGLCIGLERSHYSTGSSSATGNSGLDMTGFTLSFHF